MNDKGQVLVVFVLIMPLLLLLAAYIVDITYMTYHSNKLNEINKLVITSAKKDELSREEIIEYLNKNDSEIEIETLVINTNKIEIVLKKEIKSIFGNIIGKKSYVLTSNQSIEITNTDLPLYQ